MKRIGWNVLLAVLLLALSIAIPAAATEQPVGNVTAVCGAATVETGDSVVVRLTNQDMTVSSFTCGLEFDPELLRVTAVNGVSIETLEDTGWEPCALSTPEQANETGTVGFAYANSGDRAYRAGTLAQITFEAIGEGTAEWILYEDSDGLDGGIWDTVQTLSCQILHVHRYESTVTPPTCTEKGYTEYTCTGCGDSYRGDPVDMLDHSFGEWETVIQATCTEDGLECRVCEGCMLEETRDISAAHQETVLASVAPDCTEPGLTEGVYCAACDTVLIEQLPLEPLGHTPAEIPRKEAGCETSGLTQGSVCSVCGAVLQAQEMIPAPGHAWDEGTETLTPTESTAGIMTYTCLQCGRVKEILIPPLEHVHSYTAAATAPTCTGQGYTVYQCACGESYMDGFAAPLGHSETTDPGSEASCTGSGLTEGKHCVVCGEILIPQERIPAAHMWDEGVVTVEPAQETAGMMIHTCTSCGESKEVSIPPLGHVHSYQEAVTEPSCTEQGYTTFTCQCGDSYKDLYTDALGHDVSADPAEGAACTETGRTEGTHCDRCHETLIPQETVPALGHQWDAGVETAAPTEKTPGIMTYTCQRCGETKEETLASLSHFHSYGAVVTEPSCTEQGYTTFTCECADLYRDNFTAVLGHQWDEGIVTLEPTLTTTGIRSHTCLRCSEVKEETLPVIPHTHSYDVTVTAPTCTQQGFHTYVCICGDTYTAEYVAPLGHTYAAEENGCVCTACAEEWYLRILEEYLILEEGDSHPLTWEAAPGELADTLTWTVEKREDGREPVISADERGVVTALSSGTGYVLATVTDGDLTLTARCRVDVTEETSVEDVQLGTRKETLELYSTDYTELDILLLLPQNDPAQQSGLTASQSAAMAAAGMEDRGHAIEALRFTNAAMEELFQLVALDDRRAAVVPTQYAVENPGEVAKSYTTAIEVKLRDQEESRVSEPLTLTVKKSKPKIRAAVPAFNSFYTNQTREIAFTGATVTEICEGTVLPDWLCLAGRTLSLTEAAPKKSDSEKITMQVKTEEWRIPVKVTLTVKNTYKIPGLKLSASTVTMTKDAKASAGMELKLLPKSKKESLSDLNVADLIAPEGYEIDYRAENGTFTLKAKEGAQAGKIKLTVKFSDTEQTLTLPLTIKMTAVSLKLSASSITLNTAAKDSKLITVTAAPKDYRIDGLDIRLTDKTGKIDKTGELEIEEENGRIRVKTTEKTPANASYRLYVSVDGSKTVYAAIKTVDKKLSVSFKAKGSLDLSFPDREAVVVPTFKNYSGDFRIADMTATTAKKEAATQYFRTVKEGDAILVSCGEETPKGTYTLRLKLTLSDGSCVENTVKLTVKRTTVKLKLSASKLSLNKTISDRAFVNVTCATQGCAFDGPIWNLMDKSGKKSAEDKLDITYSGGKLKIAVNGNTEFGATYKLTVKANEYGAGSTITVTIPTKAKSVITSKLKAVGSLDVIRDGSAVTLTPSYKNCGTETDREEKLVIYDEEGTAIADSSWTKNAVLKIRKNGEGQYVVTKVPGAELKAGQKYKAQLITAFGDGAVTINSPKVQLKAAMGSAKLSLSADSTTLFSGDKNDRVTFRIEAKDPALNNVEAVEIKNTQYKDLFRIYEYGNGEFAIGYNNGEVPAKLIGKTVTLTLKVYLEGNQTTKENATLKLKLSVTKQIP